jgi:hypothetical protein
MHAQSLAVTALFALAACPRAHPAPPAEVVPSSDDEPEAPPAAPEASFVGIWWGTIDYIPGQPHRLELTESKLNYGRPDSDTGWFIEEPYTKRGDGLLALDRPEAITEAKDACYQGMGVSVCEAPELACLRIDSVTADTIEISFGLECNNLEHHYSGKRHE